MNAKLFLAALSTAALVASAAEADPVVAIRLPQRFRALTEQYFDLRVEATGLTAPGATVRVTLNGKDVTTQLGAPEVTNDNDQDPGMDRAWTFRRVSIARPGVWTFTAVVQDGVE